MHFVSALGGGLILVGLGLVIRGFRMNKSYSGLLCILGVVSLYKGMMMLGWEGIRF